MPKALAIEWTKHLKTREEKDGLTDLINNSTTVLTRLRDMIRQGGQADTRASLKPEAFDNPNWANKQAFIMGKQYRDAQLLQLLSFLDH